MDDKDREIARLREDNEALRRALLEVGTRRIFELLDLPDEPKAPPRVN